MSMTLTMTLGMTEVARIKQLTLPADTISISRPHYSEEMRGIINHMVRRDLRDYHDIWTDSYGYDESALGSDFDWATAGSKLHKRVKTYIFRKYSVNPSEDTLRQIADTSAPERNAFTRKMDVTTEFTWRPGDIGDNRSCFFNRYRTARLKYLPQIGTSAVRTYDGETGDGRYWIFPLPILNAKYRDQPLYVGFNGYGALRNHVELYEGTMLKAAETKWGRKFALTPIELTMNEVFVNDDGRKRLVHPADLDVADFMRTIRENLRNRRAGS